MLVTRLKIGIGRVNGEGGDGWSGRGDDWEGGRLGEGGRVVRYSNEWSRCVLNLNNLENIHPRNSIVKPISISSQHFSIGYHLELKILLGKLEITFSVFEA